MRLILVRHGETEYNRRKLTLGRADVPLNDRGLAQARAVAASFARPPAAIWCSPLSRAYETARAISAATGLALVVEPDLVEMDVGEMEHLSRGELRERFPDFLGAWFSGDAPGARMPGGETLREVQDRAWGAIERLRHVAPEGEVVAVTHNFVIAAVVCRALDLPLGNFRRFRHALTSRTVIDMRDSGAALISLNDTSHLQASGLAGDPT